VLAAANAPPVVDAGPDVAIGEGDAFVRSGSFSDPDLGDSWIATVDYDDCSGVQPLILNPDKTFELNRVYGDNGMYVVSIIVTDSYNESGSDQFTVTVLNVAPTVNAGLDQTVDESTAVALAPATFNDLGTLDTHLLFGS
jgi:hypothetical protein